MPAISMFYGVILIYYFDDKQHHKPRIHMRWQMPIFVGGLTVTVEDLFASLFSG